MLKQGAPEHVHGQLAANGVRNTKERVMPALEMRAEMPAVGCTMWDTAGFLAAPKETELKGQESTIESRLPCLCSETEAGIWPLLL